MDDNLVMPRAPVNAAAALRLERLRYLADCISVLGPRALFELLCEIDAGADLVPRLEAYAARPARQVHRRQPRRPAAPPEASRAGSVFMLTACRDIERARAVPLEDEVARRGVRLKRVARHELAGPCPLCGGRDRFSVNSVKRLWHCRGCQRGGDVLDFVRHVDGCSFLEAVETLAGVEPRRSPPVRPRQVPAADPAEDEIKRRRHVLAIWEEARHPAGTPVDLYLARRQLILPPGAAGAVIRFHGTCPFGKDQAGRMIRTPAMIALVRNIVTNIPQAIHRTALTADGKPVEIGGTKRMALGPIGGGAVKLTPDENVTIALGIGEGIESTLSLLQLSGGEWAGSPAWSLLNETGMRNFPLLAGIETLVIAVDNDPPGERAAREVTERWRAADREVLLFEADADGADLNDVVNGGASP